MSHRVGKLIVSHREPLCQALQTLLGAISSYSAAENGQTKHDLLTPKLLTGIYFQAAYF